MLTVHSATDASAWDAFLSKQSFKPFLQSWTMGEVYRAIGQEPVRLEIRDGSEMMGICFGHVVPAKRGRHLAIPYGPVIKSGQRTVDNGQWNVFMETLSRIAKDHDCTFIRMSPFWPSTVHCPLSVVHSRRSPLHLLAEHLWYLPLTEIDAWDSSSLPPTPYHLQPRAEEDLFKNFRATHRNLIRRAEKEGVTVEGSNDPLRDLDHFLHLHDETRKRHGFTAYTNAFFRAQVEHFALRNELTLYLARYQDQVIASSIHMHVGGETSYHHGASSSVHQKIPASHLLQWTAIRDALKRGDHVYNFWGIAPVSGVDSGQWTVDKKHPFAGVTLFKTGFSGKVLNLMPCQDIPLSPKYYGTRLFEMVRKWRRGF